MSLSATRRRLVASIVTGLALAFVGGSAGATGQAAKPASKKATAPLSALVGQLVVAGFGGRAPSPGLLERIQDGRIGGVLLYGRNIGTAGTAALAARLQKAAAAAGRPPLLIAVDQEGGDVKRLPGAPSLAPDQMQSPLVAEAQGLATARNLAANGINVDFAPVLDVDHGGFIGPRSFGSTAAVVSSRGVAFLRGLAQGGVAATVKHFPGLGHAQKSTDGGPATVDSPADELRADLAPFQAAVAAKVPLVMVSTAIYPALGDSVPAATSSQIVQTLLRGKLGYRGVVISDSLDTPGVSPFYAPGQAAVRALAAGVDLALEPGAASANPLKDSDSAYQALLVAARTGTLTRSVIVAAYRRVQALKRSV